MSQSLSRAEDYPGFEPVGPLTEVYDGPSELQRVVDVPIPERVRFSTGLSKLDSAFGDEEGRKGIVHSSSILLSGDRGIGKSTLLTQLADRFTEYGPVIYAGGEETPDRLHERAKRLGVLQGKNRHQLYALAGTSWEKLKRECRRRKAVCLIMDSISVYKTSTVNGEAGQVKQMKTLGKLISEFCQSNEHPCLAILICHITKDGDAAGPKALEHEVDVVAHMEAVESGQGLVRFRMDKNRFGVTFRKPLFQMTKDGLKPVKSPTKTLRADPGADTVPYHPEV